MSDEIITPQEQKILDEIEKVQVDPNYLKNISNQLKEDVRQKYDSMLAITGREGSGKTTLAIILGLLADPRVDLEKHETVIRFLRENVIYAPNVDEIKKKVNELPFGSVLIFDEAIKAAYKRNFMSRDSRELMVYFSTCRKQYKIFILCIPALSDLDAYLKGRRVSTWVHIIDRDVDSRVGVAALMLPNELPLQDDVWGSKRFEKLSKLWMRGQTIFSRQNKDEQLKVFNRYPNCQKVFAFEPMPKEVEDEYIRAVKEKQAEIDEGLYDQTKPRERKYKEALETVILHLRTKGSKLEELVELIGMSKSAVWAFEQNAKKRIGINK